MNIAEMKKKLAKGCIYGFKQLIQDIIYGAAKKNIDESEILKRIIKTYSAIAHCDQHALSEELSLQAHNLAHKIYELSKSYDIDIMDKIEALVKKNFEEYSVDETEQKDIWRKFSDSIMDYMKNNNPLLANDTELKREIKQLRKKLDVFFSAAERTKMLTEYLDQKCQSSLGISNAAELQDRSGDICRINKTFDKNQQIIFLYGAPGVGKTTLVKQYANASKFNHILFVQYEKSIENTLRKLCDKKTKIEASDILDYFRGLKTRERADKTLLIIDNFNDDEAEDTQAEYQHELESDLFRALKETGIHILITTRINTQSDYLEITSLKKIKEHFLSLYNDNQPLDENEDNIIDRIINAVDNNTLLVTLAAKTYREMLPNEREQFLIDLETNQIEKVTYPAPKISGYGREPFYVQLSKILKFSAILRKNERINILSSAVLLPAGGIEKEKFISLIPSKWLASLAEMTDRSWITDDGQNVMVHAGIRAVVRQNTEVMNFENCKPYCEAINKKIDMNLVGNLDERLPYYGCAVEIFRAFGDLSEIPEANKENMLWLCYNLSDLCDHLKEKRLASQICELVDDNINLLKKEYDDVRIGQIMCGTAYSLIQEVEKLRTCHVLRSCLMVQKI